MRNVAFLSCVLLLTVAGAAEAAGSHYVRGYTRKDGTYVAPHYQTNPNGTKLDNWSTKGNVNPYTGKVGTVDPYTPSTNPTPFYTPPATPAGATAQCRDGSYSYSQHHSGTCSHHGGVSSWL